MIKMLKILTWPTKRLAGSGIGNIKILRLIFNIIISLLILKRRLIILEVDGGKLGVIVGGDSGMDSLVSNLIVGGGYEKGTTRLFKELVKPGMIVVDVGAHVGYYTILASSLVGKRGKVISYEPAPMNYSMLTDNVKLNDRANVVLSQSAVSDEKGNKQLFVTRKATGESSLVHVPVLSYDTYDVDIVTLDESLNGSKVDVVKIDVDGGEMNVVRGARGLLKSPDIILFTEVFSEGLKEAGYSSGEFWDELNGLGFSFIYMINEQTGEAHKVERDEFLHYLEGVKGVNLFCSKTKKIQDDYMMKPVSERVKKRIKTLYDIIEPRDKILDVGCGVGSLITNTLGYLPVEITAIDCDLRSIEYAKRINKHKNVKYIHAKGETLESVEKYDLAICSHVLEHVVDPSLILSNMASVVKDNGLLYVGIPNGFGDFELENLIPRMMAKTVWGRRLIDIIRREAVRDSLSDSQHIHFWTHGDMVKLLRNNGWIVEKTLNEELFGGALTDRILSHLPLLAKWNAQIANRLPSWCADNWIFVCRKGSLKDEIKNYWDAEPCGTRGISSSEGTIEYYEAVSRTRYKIEPFLIRFAEFDKWSGQKILEVGCGVGSDLVEFAKKGACVTGVDLSPKSVALAKRRLDVYHLSGQVLETDAEQLPFGDEQFNMVYSFGVIHHTPNPQKAIAEIHRVVKKGGQIRIMLYHKWSLVSLQMYILFALFRLRPFRGIDDILDKHHESPGTKAYSLRQVRKLFNDFKDVSVETALSLHDIRYGRNKYLPLWVMKCIPSRLGWHILIRGRK